MKYIKATLLASAALILGGCVSTSAVNSDVSLPKNNKFGLMAIAVRCKSKEYSTMGKVINFGSSYSQLNIHYTADKGGFFADEGTIGVGECNNKTKYFMHKVSVGSYNIDEFDMYHNANIVGTVKIPFNIVANKVTYIGQLQIKYTAQDNFIYHFIDHSKTDLGYFNARYKNIPAKTYRVEIPK